MAINDLDKFLDDEVETESVNENDSNIAVDEDNGEAESDSITLTKKDYQLLKQAYDTRTELQKQAQMVSTARELFTKQVEEFNKRAEKAGKEAEKSAKQTPKEAQPQVQQQTNQEPKEYQPSLNEQIMLELKIKDSWAEFFQSNPDVDETIVNNIKNFMANNLKNGVLHHPQEIFNMFYGNGIAKNHVEKMKAEEEKRKKMQTIRRNPRDLFEKAKPAKSVDDAVDQVMAEYLGLTTK